MFPNSTAIGESEKNVSFTASELLEEEKAAIILVFVTPQLNAF